MGLRASCMRSHAAAAHEESTARVTLEERKPPFSSVADVVRMTRDPASTGKGGMQVLRSGQSMLV